MPKSLRKSCNAPISRYFAKLSSSSSSSSSSNTHCGIKQKPNEHQVSGGKQKRSSKDVGLPTKRAKLSAQDQQAEDLDCELSPCQKSKALSRGAGSLCTSTLEKLKGFNMTAEPTVRNSDSPREEERIEGASSKICHGGSDVQPPRDVPDHHSNKNRPQWAEEEQEDDDEAEEEFNEMASSGVAAKKQPFVLSQFAKSGRGGVGGGGGGKATNLNPPSDASAPSRRSKSTYTPLEQQVIQLKEKHKDALLAVECGYKYRFFGEDAEIAAKELNIICHLDHNFMTCSIPTHRLFVHVRRLVSHGHKVGVVKQTETSAIKALGVNRNALFTRQLSALYTKCKPVGRLEDAEEGVCGDVAVDPPDSFLLCISENWDKVKTQLTVGLVAVQPSTGDVLLDCFPEGQSRSELETRLLKINPVEILVPSDLSEQTHRLLQSIANASVQADDRVRVEKRDSFQFEFASAMNTVTEFYCHTHEKGARSLSSVVSLESPVICCLGPLIQYLQEFNLERVLRSESSFLHLSCKSEGMNLSAATLRNLEILNNQTDGGVRGSLLWVLDHTRTPFGRRLMRKWVTQPLTDPQSISQRQDAVQEILESDSLAINSTRSLLSHLPDLERGICSIYHKKSSTQQFYLISSSLSRLGLELQALLPAIQSQISSTLLHDLLLDTPDLLAPAHDFLKVLNETAAKSGNKTELFSDLSGFPVLQERRDQIQTVLNEIQDHRREVRVTLKAPALEYTTVSGQEFLIEVKNSQLSTVPRNWVKISRPEVCANQRQILIRDGRHPAIDLLMGEHNQFVPNHTELQGDGRRTMIITGPNMGGKSSYIRQVMGASDNIYKGRSTFMEELTEASEIISFATERSLVILDELGRGTSTHDGIAIAYATLEHFIRDVKSFTLFVTHYPPLCELERAYPEHVSNYHMAFLLNEPDIITDTDDEEVQPEFVTFLYQLTEGAAGRSYGLNVARLADIPDPILHTAARKAQELESTINTRRKSKKLLSDFWSISDRSSLMEWQKSLDS
ncbi:hypothetical protein INR49_028041 [Caranx melampygus]|nr:hypothetical protein INR49_028041 [Caranx melampygus]